MYCIFKKISNYWKFNTIRKRMFRIFMEIREDISWKANISLESFPIILFLILDRMLWYRPYKSCLQKQHVKAPDGCSQHIRKNFCNVKHFASNNCPEWIQAVRKGEDMLQLNGTYNLINSIGKFALFLIFSSNFEAKASKLLENIDKIFHRYK